MQPNETVQLFFNGNNEKIQNNSEEKHNNVYKDYIITQNTNLLKENKKLVIDNLDLNNKYQEMEEEVTQTEKRLHNTKNYLKNFRFINKNVDKLSSEYNKFVKTISTDHLINILRLLLVCFAVIMIVFYVAFTNWTLAITFTILHSLFLYIIDKVVYVPQLNKIENHKNLVIDFEKQIKKENKAMEKTMDIISEFIDNAL